MKKIFVVMLIILSQKVFAQQLEQNVSRISVTGSVELKETADQASISFSVKGVGSSLRKAVEAANKNTKLITDKLLALGVKGKDISTSSFYSGENGDDKAFLSSSRDYQASILTMIKIDSLKLLEPVILTISESEVQSLSEINFSLKDEAKFRKQARIEAVLKAKEKAEDMAKALNASVGKVLSIDEIQPVQIFAQRYSGFSANSLLNNRMQKAEGATSDESLGAGLFAQTISITGQVSVSFELK